jgi:acyl-CoA reductase-like NAD-dependent aldehyde dehydrogenase
MLTIHHPDDVPALENEGKVDRLDAARTGYPVIAPVRMVPDFAAALVEASYDRYGLAATVLTGDMANAQEAWRRLPVGTVKINDVFGGAPGGASEPRRASGTGFGFGPELLDEMTAMKVVHWSPPVIERA